MDALTIILGSLAVWRVTHMLFDELGPFGAFARFRAWTATKDETVGGIADLFDCFLCLSVWVGAIASLFISNTLKEFILNTLALSASAILINRVFNRLEQ